MAREHDDPKYKIKEQNAGTNKHRFKQRVEKVMV